MDTTRVVLVLITGCILLLSGLLVAEGLRLRLFTTGSGSEGAGHALYGRIGLSAEAMGWPWVVLGCSWTGVLAGLWLRRHWSRRAGSLLAVLSLVFVGWGTFLAAALLACLNLPVITKWLGDDDASKTERMAPDSLH
jgi:hypothetical protein